MGSGFKTFTATVLTASEMNNYLMEQSVMSFASTGARDVAVTAPEAGMVAYIRSNDSSEGLYHYSSASAWRKGPGWNSPWGVQAAAKITSGTSSSGATPTTVSGFSISTPSLPANRYLKHTVSGHIIFGSVNDTGRIAIYNAASSGSEVASSDYTPYANSTTIAFGISFSWYETTTTTAALDRRIVVYRATGSSSNIRFFADATRPAIYTIEDIGPSGAPA